MRVKEAIKTYAHISGVIYDYQYLEVNDVSLKCIPFNTQDNFDELVHTYTGEVLDEPVCGVVFFGYGEEIVAIVHEKTHSDLDFFADWMDNELEV